MSITTKLIAASLIVLASGCAVSPAPSDSAAGNASAPQLENEAPRPVAEFPPQVMYQLLVAELAGQRGQLNVAVVNYLAAAKESQDPLVAERAARIAVFAQALREALEAASLWVELDPSNPDAHQMVAPLLLAFGRAPEAAQHYEQFITMSASQPDRGLMQVASQLARDKNAVAAMSVMDKLLESRQDNAYAWLAHGQLAMRQGKLPLALTSTDQALALKRHWSPAVVQRSHILSLQGDKTAAIEYLEGELDGALADDIGVGLSHARLLAETEQLEAARDEFERLAEKAPRNAEVLYAAGVLALQLNDFEQAKQRLQQVLRLGQRMLESSYYLGRVHEQQGNIEVALKYYFSVRHGQFYLNAQSRAANLLADQGKLDRALEHLHSLRVSSEQEQVRLYLVEGELLRKAEKYREALDFFTEKLKELPNDTALRYARALVAERLDELALAEEDLRAIIKREPSNAQALNALGYTLADRTERYEEALNLIERALEVEPRDAAIIDSLGWVQYRMGNYEKAVEHLRRALELIKDPEIAAHLGEVLWEMGKKKDALEVVEESLKQHPNHKALLEVMKRFGL